MMTNMIGTTSAKAASPMIGRHLGEDLFGAIRRRRDAVGRQHAKGDRTVQPLAAQLLGDEWLAEQDPFDPVVPRLGVELREVCV